MSLKERIEEKIQQHPQADDLEIAKMVYHDDHPGEEYPSKAPSVQHVGRTRRKMKAMAGSPEFEVEHVEEPVYQEPDEDEGPPIEEPPFSETFEPPEIEAPEEEPNQYVPGPRGDEVAFMLVFTFDKLADWTGWEGWRFTTDDQGQLTDPNERRFAELTQQMADKYLPEILDQYMLEIMFCYAAVMLIGGRTIEYGRWRKAQQHPVKEVKSTATVVESEQPPDLEISPEEEAPATTNAESEREPLRPGELAYGEASNASRRREQQPTSCATHSPPRP